VRAGCIMCRGREKERRERREGGTVYFVIAALVSFCSLFISMSYNPP